MCSGQWIENNDQSCLSWCPVTAETVDSCTAADRPAAVRSYHSSSLLTSSVTSCCKHFKFTIGVRHRQHIRHPSWHRPHYKKCLDLLKNSYKTRWPSRTSPTQQWIAGCLTLLEILEIFWKFANILEVFWLSSCVCCYYDSLSQFLYFLVVSRNTRFRIQL